MPSSESNLVKLKGMIRFGKTTNPVVDKGLALPVVRGDSLYNNGNAVAFFPYGFHAAPEEGNLSLQFAIEGNASNRVVLVGSPDRRPVIEANEVVVYHPATGSKIHFKASGDVVVDTPKATFTGDAEIEGDLLVKGDHTVEGSSVLSSTVTSAGADISNSHSHAAGSYLDSVAGAVTGVSGTPI